MPNPPQFRVVAQYTDGFRVIATCWTRADAERLADRYAFGLDPDADECPEMLIEEVANA